MSSESPIIRALGLVLLCCVLHPSASFAQRSPKPLDPASRSLFEKVFGMVLRDYVDPKSPEEVIRGALQGAAQSAGPECAYIPPEEANAYRALSSPACGLPLYVTKDTDFAEVLAFYPGEGAGVLPGDALRFIGTRSTYDMTYPQILLSLRGDEGTSVKCVFLNRDTWESKTLLLKRRLPDPPTWRSLPRGNGVLAVPCLEADPSRRVAGALKAMKGTTVVDLRGCASGDIAAALKWIGILLGPHHAPLRKGQDGTVSDAVTGPGYLAAKRMRVVVDDSTARGGEVLASALAGAGALVVGEPTYGWAPRIRDYPLQDGGILRLVTAYYAAPDGDLMDDHPCVPDVTIHPRGGEKTSAFFLRVLRAKRPAAHRVERDAG